MTKTTGGGVVRVAGRAKATETVQGKVIQESRRKRVLLCLQSTPLMTRVQTLRSTPPGIMARVGNFSLVLQLVGRRTQRMGLRRFGSRFCYISTSPTSCLSSEYFSGRCGMTMLTKNIAAT